MRPLHCSVPSTLLAIFLCNVPALAQRPVKPFNNASIQVQVRLPDGTAGPRGAMVSLLAEDGSPVDEGQTDTSGRCRFTPPVPTVYVVRVKQPGYLEASARLDMQNTQTAFANISLKPDPSHPPIAEAIAPPSAVSAIDLSVPAESRKEFALGQHALEAHDLDGGVAHLKKAIELHDQFPQAYTLLGMA